MHSSSTGYHEGNLNVYLAYIVTCGGQPKEKFYTSQTNVLGTNLLTTEGTKASLAWTGDSNQEFEIVCAPQTAPPPTALPGVVEIQNNIKQRPSVSNATTSQATA